MVVRDCGWTEGGRGLDGRRRGANRVWRGANRATGFGWKTEGCEPGVDGGLDGRRRGANRVWTEVCRNRNRTSRSRVRALRSPDFMRIILSSSSLPPGGGSSDQSNY